MEAQQIVEGLLTWICMIVIVTFHEFGHAFTAWKCGDDTSRLQGRVTLNPLSHMDLWGTVILPLAGAMMAGFFFGWGRPVEVNLGNLRRRTLDDILVSMAGPFMNVVLALAVMVLARLGQVMEIPSLTEFCVRLAALSMYLCFFNLLPIPPLDGSRVLRYAVGMKEETFMHLSQFGFMILMMVIFAVPAVFLAINKATLWSMVGLSFVTGLK